MKVEVKIEEGGYESEIVMYQKRVIEVLNKQTEIYSREEKTWLRTVEMDRVLPYPIYISLSSTLEGSVHQEIFRAAAD